MSENLNSTLRSGRKRTLAESNNNFHDEEAAIAGSSSGTKASTRSLRSKHWLVGFSIEKITGARSPLNLQVLRRYLDFREESSKTSPRRDIAKVILEELLAFFFWKRPRIHTKDEKHCLDIIKNVALAYEKLKKTPINRRNTPICSQNVQVFMDFMYSLCDLSHTCSYDILRKSGCAEWEVDWQFL
jgi:hypothetical protein